MRKRRKLSISIQILIGFLAGSACIVDTWAQQVGQVVYEADFDSTNTGRVEVLNSSSGVKPGVGRDGSACYVGHTTTHVEGGALCSIQSVPFQEGRDYRVSVWIRGDAPQLSAWLYYYPSAGDSMRFKTTTEWQQHEAVITFKEGIYNSPVAKSLKLSPRSGGRIRFFTGYTPDPGGRVYFDDLKVELLPPTLRAEVKSISDEDRLEITVNTAGFEELAARRDLRVTSMIVPVNGEPEADFSQTVVPHDPVSQIALSVKGLAAGRYLVRTRLATASGEELASVETPYELLGDLEGIGTEASWEANKLGVLAPEADAPAPWTNLEVDGTTVTCWGRSYQLEGLGLPGKIEVLGRDILAAPIQLLIEPASGALRETGLHITSQTAQKVTAEGAAQGGGLKVEMTSEIEFDGMMRVTVDLEPRANNAAVSSMTLDIPLNPEIARYVLPYSAEGKAEDCRLDPAHPYVHKPFNYHIWIGDEDRGFAWFAEDDAGWQVGQKPCFETLFADDRVTLRINMIDRPTRIDQPVRIVFGMQATPVKPRRDGWVNYNYRTKDSANCNVTWPRATYQKYMGYPEAPDDSALWERMVGGIPYELPLIYVNYLHDEHPFYRYYEDRLESPGTVFELTGTDYEGRLRPVKAYLPLWKDQFMRSLDRYIRRWELKGLYHDVWDPPIDDEGKMHIWDFRDLVKRVYLLHRSVEPDAIMIVHSTSRLAPCVSFTDVNLFGEQVRNDLIKDGYYLSVMDLEQFRVEFGVVDFGVHPMFLPQFKLAWGDDPARGLHASGLCFLHDMTMWVSFMNREPFDALEPVWRLWRTGGRFHPYWKKDDAGFAIQPADDAVAVSYYESPRGALLVAVNTQDDRVGTSLAIDLAGLGLSQDARVVIHDYLNAPPPTYTREGRIEADGTIKIEMQEYDVLLIEVFK